MLSRILIGLTLMALCVAVHAGGLSAALRRLPRRVDPAQPFWRSTGLFVAVAAWLVLLHLLEMTTWAIVYYRNDAIAGLQNAFYFSAVTYTTTGYGDLVLPEAWRLVGGVEALTGILMCGWSSGFFFAVVNRMYQTRVSRASTDI
jgi:hypothetical protein